MSTIDQEGEGTPKDLEKAREWFLKVVLPALTLNQKLPRPEYESHTKRYACAAKASLMEGDAAYNLGRMELEAKDQDIESAVNYFRYGLFAKLLIRH